jgi:hypothetical protein
MLSFVIARSGSDAAIQRYWIASLCSR